MSHVAITYKGFHVEFMYWYDERADKFACRRIWEDGLQQVFPEMQSSEIFDIYLQTICRLLDMYDQSMVTSEGFAGLSEYDMDQPGKLCCLQSTQHSFDSFRYSAGIKYEPLD